MKKPNVSISYNWNGKEAKQRAIAGGLAALKENAVHLKGKSSAEAPIDTGDLRRNCSIDESELQNRHFILVGYSLIYARRQHEELGYRHPQGGKAKYLEDPFNANVERYKQNVAKKMGDNLK